MSFSQFPSYVFSYAVAQTTVEDAVLQQDFSSWLLPFLLPIEVGSYYDSDCRDICSLFTQYTAKTSNQDLEHSCVFTSETS